jgi:hypothetical protein
MRSPIYAGGRVHNQLLLLSRDHEAAFPFRSGVSLHGHTRHSKESLGFIGEFLARHRPLRSWIDSQRDYCSCSSGITLNFDRAYWTPPLCERQAHEVEARQIESLGLRPMVSLSDHDTIDACTLLRSQPEFRDTPISTEWTIYWGAAIFHIGVHNLPPLLASSLMAAMSETTASRDEDRILALLAELYRIPDVLIVFNHPLWNFMRIASRRFPFELTRFLTAAGAWIHAFELNGMRSHEENRGVLRLAAAWDQIILSGGDRHGCEPNASINLTDAADFSEFVDEVRNGRQSTVLIMPQYDEPLAWRFYQNFTHVIADYPGHPEDRRSWDQRTFHPDRNGDVVPMAQLWRVSPPEFLKTIFDAALLAARLPTRSLLRRWRRSDSESLIGHSQGLRSPESPSLGRPSASFPPQPSPVTAYSARPLDTATEECRYAPAELAAD